MITERIRGSSDGSTLVLANPDPRGTEFGLLALQGPCHSVLALRVGTQLGREEARI